jgi:hypothetical protein
MSTIKAVFGIFVMVATVYLGVQLIPPYFSNYQFEDAIKNEATLSTYSLKPEDAIRDTIFKKAQDLEIPVGKDGIKVRRNGAVGSGSLVIEADYTVHVDLPGYPLDLHFNPSTSNKGVF